MRNPAAEWPSLFHCRPPRGIGIGIGSVLRSIPIVRRRTLSRL
jgi:hypothetical protein